MPRDSFSWSRWRRFGLFAALDMVCRTNNILCRRETLRRYAVGWLEGEKPTCRLKQGTMAVMWLEDGHFTWCRLSEPEFLAVFGGYQCSD